MKQPQVEIGVGLLEKWAELVPQVKRPLFVTRGSVKELYLPKIMASAVASFEWYQVFSDFTPCPMLTQAKSCPADWLSQCDALVAIGGGSAIDCAKAIKHGLMEQTATAATLPIVAVTTTFGSGSEVTPFAVIYTEKGKISLSAPELRPDVVISDAACGLSVPVAQRAAAAVDALCQGIEAYWSQSSSDESREHALQCIKITLESITSGVLGDDLRVQEHLAQASLLSGFAITVSRTTAAHALSYYFTQFHGLAHGHAVALLMRELFAINFPYVKGGEALLSALGLKDSAEFKLWLEQLMEKLGLISSFASLTLSAEEIDRAVATVNLQRLANNPAPLTAEQLKQLIC